MKLSKAERDANHKFTTPEMELALSKHFNIRRNIIVPNVSYALFNHETDLLVLTNAGYATEIEIKVSAWDLKKDKKKRHKHNSKLIHKLFFAIPYYLKNYIEDIPSKAGILLVHPPYRKRYYIECLRGPELNKSPKWTAEQRYELVRLSTMRVWFLKEKIYNLLRNSR